MSITLNFSTLIVAAFNFANSLFPVLGPIAGIGIGFSLAIGAMGWLGGMLGKIFKSAR